MAEGEGSLPAGVSERDRQADRWILLFFLLQSQLSTVVSRASNPHYWVAADLKHKAHLLPILVAVRGRVWTDNPLKCELTDKPAAIVEVSEPAPSTTVSSCGAQLPSSLLQVQGRQQEQDRTWQGRLELHAQRPQGLWNCRSRPDP
jgi:hypothetical protein